MAVVTPYFNPVVDTSLPLFANYFNGFMQRRTADALTAQKLRLENMDLKSLNAELQMYQKHKQELILKRADLMKTSLEQRGKIISQYLAQAGASSVAATNFKRAIVTGKSNIGQELVKAATKSGSRGKYAEAIKNDTGIIFRGLQKKSTIKENIKTQIKNFTTGSRAKDYEAIVQYAVDEFGVEDKAINNPARNKAIVAALFGQLMQEDPALFKDPGAQKLLEFLYIDTNIQIELESTPQRADIRAAGKKIKKETEEPEQLSAEENLKHATKAADLGQLYFAPQAQIEKNIQKIEELGLPHARKTKLSKKEKDEQKTWLDNTANSEKVKKINVLQNDNKVHRKNIVRPSGFGFGKVKRAIKDLAPELGGKKAAEKALSSIDDQINALDRILLAKGIEKREKVYEIAKDPAGYRYKGIKGRNWLLENPWKKDTPTTERYKGFMKLHK